MNNKRRIIENDGVAAYDNSFDQIDLVSTWHMTSG